MEKVNGNDLEKLKADDVVVLRGISKLPNDQLLFSLLECLDNMYFFSIHGTNRERIQSDLECAPTSYEVYKRFYNGKRPAFLEHPSLKKQYTPSDLMFWSQPAALDLLFNALLADGYFQKRPSRGRSHTEEFYASA